jgi:hypothetical protein
MRGLGQAIFRRVNTRLASASFASRRGRRPSQRSISAGGSPSLSRWPNSTQVLVVLLPYCALKIGHTRSNAQPPVIPTRTRFILPPRKPAKTGAFRTA